MLPRALRVPARLTIRVRASTEHNAFPGEKGDVEGTKALVIKPKLTLRQPGEPPKPVSIERTSSFLIHNGKKLESDDETYDEILMQQRIEMKESSDVEMNFEENPVEWVLKRADASLDAAGERVPDAARGAITYMTGTVSVKASKYAFGAVKLAAKGSSKVLEAALPAGKWMLSRGFSAISKSISSASKDDGDKKDMK